MSVCIYVSSAPMSTSQTTLVVWGSIGMHNDDITGHLGLVTCGRSEQTGTHAAVHSDRPHYVTSVSWPTNNNNLTKKNPQKTGWRLASVSSHPLATGCGRWVPSPWDQEVADHWNAQGHGCGSYFPVRMLCHSIVSQDIRFGENPPWLCWSGMLVQNLWLPTTHPSLPDAASEFTWCGVWRTAGWLEGCVGGYRVKGAGRYAAI